MYGYCKREWGTRGADLHETREAPQKRPLDALPDGATRR